MYNKYLKYKSKYLNLKMIGGGNIEIKIYALSGEYISFEVNETDKISILFEKMDEYIRELKEQDNIKYKYIEYKLLVNKKILDKSNDEDIVNIVNTGQNINYVIHYYDVNFTNLDKLVNYINTYIGINDYSLYYFIINNMIINEMPIDIMKQKLDNYLCGKEIYRLQIEFDKWEIFLTRHHRVSLLNSFKNINNGNFFIFYIKNGIIDPFQFYNLEKIIGDELKNDIDFMTDFIIQYLNIFDYNDYQVKDKFDMLMYNKDVLLDDKNFILKAIQINFDIFKYASTRLKHDVDFILEAIQIVPIIFKYAYKIKQNKNFILNAIKIKPEIFGYISYKLKKDEDFILEAKSINPEISSYINWI